MAVVVVFWPMTVYSTSSAALKNPVGIRHIVVDIIDKPSWPNGPSAPPIVIEAARTACGSTIGYQLYDQEMRHGKHRPTKLCERCGLAKPKDVIPMIGVSGVGAGADLERDGRTRQGSLLS